MTPERWQQIEQRLSRVPPEVREELLAILTGDEAARDDALERLAKRPQGQHWIERLQELGQQPELRQRLIQTLQNAPAETEQAGGRKRRFGGLFGR